MNSIKIKLGKRIKELRKSRKLTQEKLAEIVGIDVVSMSKIETGKNYPTADNLEKISNALETVPYELYKFRAEMTDEEEEAFLNEIETNLLLIKKDTKKLQKISSLIRLFLESS